MRPPIPSQRRPSEPPSYPDGDPRSRSDGIGWVSRAVFPGSSLRLAVGGGPGDVRYAVVPNVENARFLLPLASPAVTAASMLAYNALRPPKVRLSRAVIGGLARVGALGLTRAPVLAVDGAPLLWDHLAGLLGVPRLHAAIGIRPPDPHHKPTLQLFDDQARPVGYAKIGWNDGTRAMVRSEAATLSSLPSGPGYPEVPRLLLQTQWQGREIAVIEPMPASVRRLRRPDVPLTSAMLAVARRGGDAAACVPFGTSSFLERWRQRAGGANPAITAAMDALRRRDGSLEIEFGDWHGDWVPWNMARHGSRLIVWDWENRAADTPVGFDLAHQAFQTALSTRGLPAAACAEVVDEWLGRHGRALNLDAERQRFIADAYLIELWLRTYELSHGGAGWNPKLHPALLDILAARLG